MYYLIINANEINLTKNAICLFIIENKLMFIKYKILAIIDVNKPAVDLGIEI